jgi:hypothetical protein
VLSAARPPRRRAARGRRSRRSDRLTALAVRRHWRRPDLAAGDVVAERLDLLGHPAVPEVAPDAHLEADYDDRFELGEVS